MLPQTRRWGPSREVAFAALSPLDLARPTGDVDELDGPQAGQKAVRGGLLRSLSFVAVLLLGLVSVPLLTTSLGVVKFGYYVTASSLVYVVVTVSDGGLTVLGTRRYASLDGEARELFLERLAGLRVVVAAAGVALAVFIAWVGAQPGTVVAGTAMLGVAAAFTLLQQTYAIPLAVRLRFGWIAAFDLVRQATLTALVVALVIAGSGLEWFFAAAVLACAVPLIGTAIIVSLTGRSIRPRVDLAAWRETLRDVAPYALAAAAGVVYFRLGIVLLGYVTDDREVGVYSAAFRIAEVLTVAPAIVVSTAFPLLTRAARDDESRLRHGAQRLFDVTWLLGVLLGVVLIAGAPAAISVVAPAEGFAGAVAALQFLGLALVFTFVAAGCSFVLLALGRTRAVLWCNLTALAVSVPGSLVLGAVWGASGCAAAAVLAEATLAAGCILSVRGALPGALGTSRVPLIAASAGAVGLCGILVGGPVALQTALAVLGFGAVIVLLRAVPPELAEALRRR